VQVKLFEVRDFAKAVPCFAFLLKPDEEAESFLLRRAGFGFASPLLMFGPLDDPSLIHYDPYAHTSLMIRTYRVAHQYALHHWNELKSGDVLDVEFILGETKTRKS
jgi:hypothetical protein